MVHKLTVSLNTLEKSSFSVQTLRLRGTRIGGISSHLSIPVGKVSVAGSTIAGLLILLILLFQIYIVRDLAYGSTPET